MADIQFTDREKKLLEGGDPDAVDPNLPAQDEVNAEAEAAIRDVPSYGAPRDEAPRDEAADGEEGEYADDLSPTPEEKAEAATSWIDDAAIDTAIGYGLTDQDLQQFPDKAAFDKAIADYNAQRQQQALPYAQQQHPWMLGQQPAAPPSPSPPAAQQNGEAAPPADKPGYKDGLIDVDYFKKKYAEEFDEKTTEILGEQLQLIQSLQQELKTSQSDIQAQKRAYLEQEQARARNEFHDACDALDPEFFGESLRNGRPVTLQQQYAERRQKIAQEINNTVVPRIVAQQQANGINEPVLPSMAVLVRQAKNNLFGNDPTVPGTPARREALLKQASRRRSPGSAAAGTRRATKRESGPVTVESEVEELLNNPAIQNAWEGVRV